MLHLSIYVITKTSLKRDNNKVLWTFMFTIKAATHMNCCLDDKYTAYGKIIKRINSYNMK